VKDLEGETNGMYAVKAGEKFWNRENGWRKRNGVRRKIEEGGGGGGSFEEIAVCFHGSVVSCIFYKSFGSFFS